MDVLTAGSMRRVDEETIKRFCPGLELMERAGSQVAAFILQQFPREGFKASIFVGPGNNGGDALVVARYLGEEGRRVSVHYLKDPQGLTLDAHKNHVRLQQHLAEFKGVKEINFSRPDWDSVIRKDLIDATLVVDGLFGTGLTRPIEGRAAETIRMMNQSRRPIVAIDIPSGIHSDTGEVLGEAVSASHTITMGYPKVGMLFYPGKAYVGELRVADLGFPKEVLEENSLGIRLLGRREAAGRLPARAPDIHKYDAGTVLLVAGSRRYTGAVMLAAEAVLRSGAGMVYAAVPESIVPIVQGRVREAIVVPLPQTVQGAAAPAARHALASYLDKADAVVLGPGLGDEVATRELIGDLVDLVSCPLVLDADGVTALADQLPRLRGRTAPTVITPHSGELKRLVDKPVPTEPMARIEFTREVAADLGVDVVHKGAPTLIADMENNVWINHSGNSALATAGTGDVLAGMIGGLVAQGATGLDAACVACFLHGRAGERAADVSGVRGVVAGDLLRHVGSAMIELEALER